MSIFFLILVITIRVIHFILLQRNTIMEKSKRDESLYHLGLVSLACLGFLITLLGIALFKVLLVRKQYPGYNKNGKKKTQGTSFSLTYRDILKKWNRRSKHRKRQS